MTDFERLYKETKSELDDRKWRESQEREREYQQRERHQRERQQKEREAEYRAESWNEAFSKGIRRYQKEAVEEARMVADIRRDYEGREDEMERWERSIIEEKPYFAEIAKRAEFARRALHDANEEMVDVIAILQQQIEWAREAAREQAAQKVEDEFGNCEMSEWLREDNYSALVDW